MILREAEILSSNNAAAPEDVLAYMRLWMEKSIPPDYRPSEATQTRIKAIAGEIARSWMMGVDWPPSEGETIYWRETSDPDHTVSCRDTIRVSDIAPAYKLAEAWLNIDDSESRTPWRPL